jgi:tetraacyldisaccharide 4'-kinase
MVHRFAKFKWLLAPLLPLLWLYYIIVTVRNFCYDRGVCKSKKLPALVISVGNLSLGGTGKTPATIFLARALRDQGWRVVVVARGYGRQGRGLVVVSDGQHVLADIAAAGDEPLLLAQECDGIPVVVDRQKKTAAMAAVEKFSPDIILVDDGFQHRQLYRQINVVMVDATTHLNSFWWNIASPLREPASALRRADFIILNTSGISNPKQFERITEQCHRYTAAPIFTGMLKALGWRKLENEPDKGQSDKFASLQVASTKKQPLNRHLRLAPCPLLPLSIIKGQPVVLVSGIARPERFRKLVETHGAQIQRELIFADHHNYKGNDARDIEATFRHCGARYILTTAKDAVKLSRLVDSGSTSALPFLVLEMAFEAEPEALPAMLNVIRGRGPE